MIQGAVNSITEGGSALGEAIEHAIDGDGGEAVEDLVRVGLEAAGIAATMSGGPIGEGAVEALEGVLDEAVLEDKTGDVPGPGGKEGEFDAESLLQGALEGALQGSTGVLGGEAGGEALLGKLLGVAMNGGLDALLSDPSGDGSSEAVQGRLRNAGAGTRKMNEMQGSRMEARRRVQSASV